MARWLQHAWGMFWWPEDLRAVTVQRHRWRPERAADLARGGGGALDLVVAVFIVAGEAAELVAGGLGGLRVVCRGLRGSRRAGERPEFQQRARCGRTVQVPVRDDRALVSAPGAAVVGVEVLDEGGAGPPERDYSVSRDAVGVAGVCQDIAQRGSRLAAWRSARGRARGRGRDGRRTGSSAGELGHGRPLLAGNRDGGRQVIAVEQLVLIVGAGCSCGAPRRPRGRRSRGCRAAGAGRRIPCRSSPPPASCPRP